ncbi:hypothetical protein PIB30_047334 [Stylosanthes scabra]|uniref:Ubiquitin-like protease family profile domain-containing protein n=1 Tax=Stylosanthes scabra TaxID=79078 RepID=A0ABU6RHH2_9FABA|nr:hypothetical protein [Stylosanthes scabra]
MAITALTRTLENQASTNLHGSTQTTTPKNIQIAQKKGASSCSLPRRTHGPEIPLQFALSWSRPPNKVREQFAQHFMHKVDYLSRIFVPINDLNEHWFLVIVDMKKKQLIVLDSSKNIDKDYNRRLSVETMAIFIERMLQHNSFYNSTNILIPKVSKFDIVEPSDLPQ